MVEPTHLNNICQIGSFSPRIRGEHEKLFESIWKYHLAHMDIMKPENETEEKIFKSHVPGLFQRYLVGVFMVPLLMFWEVPNSWIPWLQGISASPTKDLQDVLGLSMFFFSSPCSRENKKDFA